MFCIVSPYYNSYNNKFQRSTYYSLFLSILYATGLSERQSATVECERSASELSETWLNEVNKVPSSLPGRVAEVVLSCGRLFLSSGSRLSSAVAWPLDQVAFYRGYLGTKSSMYYVEIYCYKNCSTVKLYKTQKMAANQVNFMKLF